VDKDEFEKYKSYIDDIEVDSNKKWCWQILVFIVFFLTRFVNGN
jgi:hypothetical protein